MSRCVFTVDVFLHIINYYYLFNLTYSYVLHYADFADLLLFAVNDIQVIPPITSIDNNL